MLVAYLFAHAALADRSRPELGPEVAAVASARAVEVEVAPLGARQKPAAVATGAPLPPTAVRTPRPRQAKAGSPGPGLHRWDGVPLTADQADGESVDPPVEPPPPEPPPPPPSVAVTDLRLEEIGPLSAVVSFSTSREVSGVVGLGRDGPVAFASDGPGLEHRIPLTGLFPGRIYTVTAWSHEGEQKPQLAFSSGSRPPNPFASIGEGAFQLDGRPYFPVAAYGACSWDVDRLLGAGVNLFQWELGCGADASAVAESVASLAGRGYWTVQWPLRGLGGEGHVGYTHPDEPDGLGLSASMLPAIQSHGKASFVTFTQHFSPGTGALPWQGPGYYEAFVARADVIGFDVYPLQGLCRPDKLALVHDAQVDLVTLAGGKPTFQWIETAPMNCRGDGPGVAITPESVRAELLLAVAGGANGLGLFPANFDGLLAPAIRSTLDEIEGAWPMLLTSRRPVSVGGEGAAAVRASARERGGATMLVVANADRQRYAPVEIELPGLQGRELVSLDGSTAVRVDGDVAHLQLAPLEAHILVAAPASVATPWRGGAGNNPRPPSAPVRSRAP